MRIVTVDKVLKTKYLLGDNLVVAPKDKNTGQLFVGCPILFRARLDKEVFSCSFFEVVNFSPNQLNFAKCTKT